MKDEDDKKVTSINKKPQAEMEKKIRDDLDTIGEQCKARAEAEVEELEDLDDLDDVCMECRAKMEEEDDWPEHWLRCSVKEYEDFPMVIVAAGNFRYVGAFGFRSDADPNKIILFHPLLFGEAVEKDERGGQHVIPIMNKMLMTLGSVDQIYLKDDALIFLNPKNTLDKRISQMYKEAVEKFLMDDIGLVAPTMEDISKLSNMPPQGKA